jgi:hypothetical protein
MIRPGIEKTLNVSGPKIGSSQALRIPVRGLARKIHEIVYSRPGTISGTSEPTKISFRKGMLVRSVKKASTTPITTETPVAPTE